MANNQFKLPVPDFFKPFSGQEKATKKHICGAYLNLARHHMTVTLNTIFMGVGLDVIDENKIGDVFVGAHREAVNALDNIQKERLQNKLLRHFPFLKFMGLENGVPKVKKDNKKTDKPTTKSIQFDDVLSVMARFADCMRSLRNYYTHYNPSKSPRKDLRAQIGYYLQLIFENSSKGFKTKEQLVAADHEVLNSQYVPEDKKQSKDAKAKFVRNSDYYGSMQDDENGLSDTGILYFICLFLDKDTSFKMLDQTGFVDQCPFKEEDERMILKEIMCTNRIRMTKARLDSEMDETALALDMLNELRKCPRELYDVMLTDARNEFKDDMTVEWEKTHKDEAKAVDADTDDDHEKEKGKPQSTFVRWRDRFPYFALSYIDYNGVFDDIRFQLSLGKYRFDFYDKTCVDGVEKLRVLQKNVHGFGRIQEVEKERKVLWRKQPEHKDLMKGILQKKPDTTIANGQTTYVTDQRAQYDIDSKSNSIGLRWSGWDQNLYSQLEEKKMFIPKLRVGGEKRNDMQSLLPPQCMLSLYELPALIFHHYLTKDCDKHATEELIKYQYEQLKLFFAKAQQPDFGPFGSEEALTEALKREGIDIQLKDIPQKLRNYLSGKGLPNNQQRLLESARRCLRERLQRKMKALEMFQMKLAKIGKKENKYGKGRVNIQPGKLAQQLMRDIVEWMPTLTGGKIPTAFDNGRNKPTGLNYQSMQSSLALFGQTVDVTGLKKIYEEAGIYSLQKGIGHPFIDKVIDGYTEKENGKDVKVPSPKNCEQFYQRYLEYEIKYLRRRIQASEQSEGNEKLYKSIPFIHHYRRRWQDTDDEGMRNLAKRYGDNPVQLPNGLFTSAILQCIEKKCENGKEIKKAISATGTKGHASDLLGSVAYLINLYFSKWEKDHVQLFYNSDYSQSAYVHVYDLFKKLQNRRVNNSLQPAPKSAKEINRLFSEWYMEGTPTQKVLRMDRSGNVIVNEEKEPCYMKQIHKLIQDFPDKMMEEEIAKAIQRIDEKIRRQRMIANQREDEIRKAKKNYQLSDEEKWDLREKLLKKIPKIKKNEREIRRYRIQDIVIFWMAREILKVKKREDLVKANPGDVNKVEEGYRNFMRDFNLKYLLSHNSLKELKDALKEKADKKDTDLSGLKRDLLDKTIDFSWGVIVGQDENGNDIVKYIQQKDMKLKNYGQFYKFASDHERLRSLLIQLQDDTFERAHIENEFKKYDLNRSEVFKLVYLIESKALFMDGYDLLDAKAAEAHIDDNPEKELRRDHFWALLDVAVKGGDKKWSDEELKLLQEIRNAFGHNSYDIDLDKVFENRLEKKKIPEVSEGVTRKMEEKTDEIIAPQRRN